ncbi:MAG: DHH family phosphoesterase [Bdellovibrionaceae bacterium]|nr:DHH family phosphoesterase [Pseudobdellovibrionaceae bacterium]
MISIPRLNNLNVKSITRQIQDAGSILLTTHKQCDGDGLGAMLGLYHALKKSGKRVRVFAVDEIPPKYSYLKPHKYIDIYDQKHSPIETTDLCLIFDTNDKRLVEPLYKELEIKCRNIFFVDHHPILNQGPEPTVGSYIETSAASTGEIAYFIIKDLGIRLDENISQALYTSIAFDTQIFRYVKGAPSSHLICAELLNYVTEPEEIHRHMFATFSQEKIAFLAKVLSEIEYYSGGQIAILKLSLEDINNNNLHMDDSRDVIDMIMNVTTVITAALFRQDNVNGYKMSLRSKDKIEILGIAENYGGGGHMHAAGAYIEGDYATIKKDVVDQLLQRLDGHISKINEK